LPSFQFLGIPPKGEQYAGTVVTGLYWRFPISRDPPEGGTSLSLNKGGLLCLPFPISRDPPEGGT